MTTKKQKSIVICIANHKGGVGKTTTAVTLSCGLAGMGYPTTLIDCDSQGNVAHFLGLERRASLYELIIQEKVISEITQGIKAYPKLKIITGNQDSLEIENALNAGRRHKTASAIKDGIEPFKAHSNGKPMIIIMDTAPSLSALQVSALNAADWLIIPASPEYASEAGLSTLVRAVADLHSIGSGIDLLGILPTLVDYRSNEHKETIRDLEREFPDMVLYPVRRLISIAEAPREGLPIWDYDQKATDDYSVVLAQIMKKVGLRQ